MAPTIFLVLLTRTVLVLSAINVDSCRNSSFWKQDPRRDAEYTTQFQFAALSQKHPRSQDSEPRAKGHLFFYFDFDLGFDLGFDSGCDFDIDTLLCHDGCGGCIAASVVMVEVSDLT